MIIIIIAVLVTIWPGHSTVEFKGKLENARKKEAQQRRRERDTK
jgi:hypothetical protein